MSDVFQCRIETSVFFSVRQYGHIPGFPQSGFLSTAKITSSTFLVFLEITGLPASLPYSLIFLEVLSDHLVDPKKNVCLPSTLTSGSGN